MKKPVRVTVVDVARRAEVSPATVSNAINNTRYVDADTKKRIDRAIKELGYVPNLKARRLRTGKANAIAVVSSMPFSISAGQSRLGFMMEIAASAAVAALEQRLSLVLVPPLPAGDPGFDHLEVDGVLVIEPSADDPHLEDLKRRGVPVVAIGRPGWGASAEAPYVDLQSKAVTEKVFAHFLEQGARAPALFVGMTDRSAFHETETAYRRLAQSAGFEPVVLYLDERAGEQAGYEAGRRLVEHHPEVDALFVLIDTFATGAVRAFAEMGIDVPGSMRIATRYDGLRARESTPKLTAFNLHLDEIARLALERLLQEMDGKSGPQQMTGLEPELVVRESSSSTV
ncbi:LacI family DNA-binding transcriptional regulator [uncultured Roseibium sp.]|uniref:LacI family DNA-binding transcriptional regulator n=1 Tax=uncultured Roseibium sp. TaxID=1936171 RepID=UPI003216FCBA